MAHPAGAGKKDKKLIRVPSAESLPDLVSSLYICLDPLKKIREYNQYYQYHKNNIYHIKIDNQLGIPP